MHVFFSGIGGTGIGPLALIAKQAGYTVSGSDKQDSQYVDYLRQKGIVDIHIGQNETSIANVNGKNPIDWYVYSSALEKENPNHPELEFVKSKNIKSTKRDELINTILRDKNLKMIAVAGTHGKTTTTAMCIWLFKQLSIPISYSVGAKIPFGDMGHYDPKSQYFVYEADEFDRNFLAFHPFLSMITGVSWDHHEVFLREKDYFQAFNDFIKQSKQVVVWQQDQARIKCSAGADCVVIDEHDASLKRIKLTGLVNQQNAWQVMQAVHKITGESLEVLQSHTERFPGLQRRMEELAPNLYTDYAHTPDKIRGGMTIARAMAEQTNQNIIIVYEGLTNRRQHYMINDYQDCFNGAKKVYWLPSYLAREDPNLQVISPEKMIQHLKDPSIAEAMKRDEGLKQVVREHLDAGDLVIGMAGGGGGSLDEWLRKEFQHKL